jgi:uncharacterized SAM-binding protein YcdF (DUF218 family)
MAKIFLMAILLMMTLLVIFAPRYLAYSDVPRKSDAIVLFIGPGNEERLNEARQLIRDGYANYLIIPLYGEVLKVSDNGALERISNQSDQLEKLKHIRNALYNRNYFEDTHVEALEAKRILDDLRLRSAILVSSPYHMRRIKLIAGSVFHNGTYSINIVPTRFQGSFTLADWLVDAHRKMMVTEFIKIGWFFIYTVVGY